MTEPAVGDQLGDLRLEAVVGRGGMGVVYRATQLRLDRTVAVKVIAPALAADATFRARFEREARILAAVDHPNVIPVHGAGQDGDRLYLVMRWVGGRDLGQVIAQSGGLEPDRALQLLRQLAGALDAVHAAGLVHRDLKPANVLLDQPPGGGERAYLTDFGAGRRLDAPSDVTATGTWLGTLDYVAPETLAGAPPGPAGDRYALACVAFELLTGAPPFRRDTPAATLSAHHQAPVPSARARRPALPAAVDAVLARGLAKDPGERYATAEQFVAALGDALAVADGAETVSGQSTVAPVAPAAPRRRGARSAVLLVAVLVAVAVALVLVLVDGDDDATTPTATASAGEPGQVARVTRVAIGPGAAASVLAAGDDAAYVADARHPAIAVVDQVSRRLLGRIDLPAAPISIALDRDHDRLWVGLEDRRLVRISTADRRVVGSPLRLPILPGDVLVRGDDVVVVQHDPARAVAVDATAARVDGPVRRLPGAATGAVVDGDDVLAIVVYPPQLLRRGPDLAAAGRRRLQATLPTDLALDSGGTLWVTDFDANRVLRLNPRTGEAAGPPIAVGRQPFALALDGTSAWVTDKGDSTVTRIDQRTGRAYRPAVATGPLAGPVAVRPGLLGGAWASGTDDVIALEPPG
jgi:serine/threonine-protein kinase